MPLSEPGFGPASFDGPLVVTPAPTDRFVVRQADGVVRVETRLQIHTLEVGEHLILPQVNEPLTPTLVIDGGTSGFFASAANVIGCSINGTEVFEIATGFLRGTQDAGQSPRLAFGSLGVFEPGFCFHSDNNTGVGARGPDNGLLLAGGVAVADFVEAAGVVQFVLPLQNDAANPSLVIDGGNSGFFASAADTIVASINGVAQFQFFSTNRFGGVSGSHPMMRAATPTDISPSLVPYRNDSTTGMGRRTTDVGVLIGGAQNCMEFAAIAAAPGVGFYGTAAIVLQTGVAVTSAGIHAALVNLGLITA